ncbi:hypothetical protein [Candidatus Methanocrinis natronophilus]|uniref:Uncharacterized protein n=1 Tax=Candidatus Methanocrinis natronophilus TaxID=3033396 RepID=A0ABT5X9C0_9EURY|nr:hypothetical protein [Candidatus Methanocrinis natronophilus]MDF0591276.1 hypothetical protein [Candidatus Methanocrinis natronophilus]
MPSSFSSSRGLGRDAVTGRTSILYPSSFLNLASSMLIKDSDSSAETRILTRMSFLSKLLFQTPFTGLSQTPRTGSIQMPSNCWPPLVRTRSSPSLSPSGMTISINLSVKLSPVEDR